MKHILIFGYGSLMSLKSLRDTVPNATGLKTARIKGFRREFNKLDKEGWKSSNHDLAGIPFCAINVTADKNGGTVNGVLFEADAAYMDHLKRRENGYELVPTTAYDFKTDKPLGECFVFSSNECDGIYEHGNPAQERYLKVCLEAAKEHGDDFYRQFLDSTYIGGEALADLL